MRVRLLHVIGIEEGEKIEREREKQNKMNFILCSLELQTTLNMRKIYVEDIIILK